MKLLIDTHAALWLFNEHEKLPTAVREHLLDEVNELYIYDLIGEDFSIGRIPQVSNYEEFSEIFDRDGRNATIPYIDRHWSMFSMLGGVCDEYWMFYSGSYKAILEVYTTLAHFERILAKTMKNPLASTIKFGIYG